MPSYLSKQLTLLLCKRYQLTYNNISIDIFQQYTFGTILKEKLLTMAKKKRELTAIYEKNCLFLFEVNPEFLTKVVVSAILLNVLKTAQQKSSQ